MIHRDDIDYDVIQQLEKEFEELYPGCKIVFAGDHEENLTPEIKKLIDRLNKQLKKDLEAGVCCDCDEKIPNFSKENIPANWVKYEDVSSKEIVSIQCPACQQKEKDNG